MWAPAETHASPSPCSGKRTPLRLCPCTPKLQSTLKNPEAPWKTQSSRGIQCHRGRREWECDATAGREVFLMERPFKKFTQNALPIFFAKWVGLLSSTVRKKCDKRRIEYEKASLNSTGAQPGLDCVMQRTPRGDPCNLSASDSQI